MSTMLGSFPILPSKQFISLGLVDIVTHENTSLFYIKIRSLVTCYVYPEMCESSFELRVENIKSFV
jgi:hypothetical protein